MLGLGVVFVVGLHNNRVWTWRLGRAYVYVISLTKFFFRIETRLKRVSAVYRQWHTREDFTTDRNQNWYYNSTRGTTIRPLNTNRWLEHVNDIADRLILNKRHFRMSRKTLWNKGELVDPTNRHDRCVYKYRLVWNKSSFKYLWIRYLLEWKCAETRKCANGRRK